MINVAFVIFLNSPTASSIVPWQIFKLCFIGGDARSTPSQTPVSVMDNGNPGAAFAIAMASQTDACSSALATAPANTAMMLISKIQKIKIRLPAGRMRRYWLYWIYGQTSTSKDNTFKVIRCLCCLAEQNSPAHFCFHVG